MHRRNVGHSRRSGASTTGLDDVSISSLARVVGASWRVWHGSSPRSKRYRKSTVHGVPFELGGLVDGVDLVGREFQRGSRR